MLEELIEFEAKRFGFHNKLNLTDNDGLLASLLFAFSGPFM